MANFNQRRGTIFAEVNATVKSGGCPARTKNATFSGSPSMNLASISCSGFCNNWYLFQLFDYDVIRLTA
jgi:hypothetical protein